MLKISNHYVSKIVFFLLFVEVLVLVGAAYAGAAVRFLGLEEGGAVPGIDHFFTSALAFAAAIIFSMSAMGMYQLNFSEGLRNPFFNKLMPSFQGALTNEQIKAVSAYVASDAFLARE